MDDDSEPDGRQADDGARHGTGVVPEDGGDLDEASYERLHRKRLRRQRRQRVVFALVVLLVLAVGGGAALVWTGRWQPGGGSAATPTPTCAPAPEQPLPPPQEVSVVVLNGTDRTGLAGGVAEELRGRGFTVPRVGNAPVDAGPVTASVRYPPGLLPAARAAAARVAEAQLVEDPAATAVELTLGDGYQQLLGEDALAVPPAPAPPPAPGC
ncbi:LytR C-terminal domain-containing protein [Kineococcus indalonis]|uniref:LytR C-terminal domain-containing protein n=1 Tax=Kineococcus indalonis TaxID=2696566 RepID=UPI001413649E|nr:LytR C-terminal domain-containing protein [Kineococcus indalonis]NAZ87405.1 hypothetical protein [Kineococcus indalonis]